MWWLPVVTTGSARPYANIGRSRTTTRGLPATLRMRRAIVVGWCRRPCCSKRGAQSVISTAPPARSVSRVTTTAVLST